MHSLLSTSLTIRLRAGYSKVGVRIIWYTHRFMPPEDMGKAFGSKCLCMLSCVVWPFSGKYFVIGKMRPAFDADVSVDHSAITDSSRPSTCARSHSSGKDNLDCQGSLPLDEEVTRLRSLVGACTLESIRDQDTCLQEEVNLGKLQNLEGARALNSSREYDTGLSAGLDGSLVASLESQQDGARIADSEWVGQSHVQEGEENLSRRLEELHGVKIVRDEEEPSHTVPTPVDGLEFPKPMSPFAGEQAKEVEFERAMVAEAAMKAGPAISKLDVLYEDQWLVVVNKPRGLYCEHVLSSAPSILSAPDQHTGSADTFGSQPHLHLANRLDRDTSGVMVITKCREAASKLTRAFTNRQVHKTYLAMCAASPPTWNQITIESGHGRSRYGAWRVYCKRDVGRSLPGGSCVRDMETRLKVVGIARPYECDAWPVPVAGDSHGAVVVVGAESDVRPIKKQEGGLLQGQQVTVIRAYPKTGRTHQIRLHCQYLGLPLCGDVKYGGPDVWQDISFNSHVLHAESLTFTHPITLENFHIVAPCPEWAAKLGIQLFLEKVET